MVPHTAAESKEKSHRNQCLYRDTFGQCGLLENNALPDKMGHASIGKTENPPGVFKNRHKKTAERAATQIDGQFRKKLLQFTYHKQGILTSLIGGAK